MKTGASDTGPKKYTPLLSMKTIIIVAIIGALGLLLLGVQELLLKYLGYEKELYAPPQTETPDVPKSKQGEQKEDTKTEDNSQNQPWTTANGPG